MNLKQFSERQLQRAERFPLRATEHFKGVVRSCVRELAHDTPVDKGVLRSNWHLSIGAPDEAVFEAFFPYPKGTDPEKFLETANAEAVIETAEEFLPFYDADQAQQEIPLIVQNNILYVNIINDGGSDQNSLFVESSVGTSLRAAKRKL